MIMISTLLGSLLGARAAQPLVLYVDPSTERHYVTESLEKRGCEYVLLHSSAAAAAILSGREDDEELCERVLTRTVPSPGEELEWAEENLGLQDGTLLLSAVLCGSDGGLADAERLQDVLVRERSNGLNPARRDKFLMNEVLRAAGLSAPLQCAPTTWEDARAFLRGPLGSRYPVVMKPRRGQASVLVGLARSEADAERMDAVLRDANVRVSIDSSELQAGDDNVVVQEYLAGEEWVVDAVSRNGEHKVVALWRYDKGEVSEPARHVHIFCPPPPSPTYLYPRPYPRSAAAQANGAPFVYFGIDAMGCNGRVEERLLEYARAVLDALGWRWGPSHIEIKMCEREGEDEAVPTLVEINAGRWNGEEFQPLAKLCNGYDALEATLDAYLDAEAWEALLANPPKQLLVHGKNVKLVSHVEGVLRAAPAQVHAETLKGLASLLTFAPEAAEAGDRISLTVDLNTCAGYAHLAHADAGIVDRDYRALRNLQPTLFDVGGVAT